MKEADGNNLFLPQHETSGRGGPHLHGSNPNTAGRLTSSSRGTALIGSLYHRSRTVGKRKDPVGAFVALR